MMCALFCPVGDALLPRCRCPALPPWRRPVASLVTLCYELQPIAAYSQQSHFSKVDSALRPYTDSRGSFSDLDVLVRDETSVRDSLVVLMLLPLRNKFVRTMWRTFIV